MNTVSRSLSQMFRVPPFIGAGSNKIELISVDGKQHQRDVITATLTLVFNANTPNGRRETRVVRAAQDRRPDTREKRATLTAGWEQ